MTKPTVAHCHAAQQMPGTVYVGRPTQWGNPFKIGPDGTRDEVIRKYRMWLGLRPSLVSDLVALNPQVLTCWCAPQACHADVLAEAIARHHNGQCVSCGAPEARHYRYGRVHVCVQCHQDIEDECDYRETTPDDDRDVPF